MTFTAVDHITINCTNLEASRYFYEKILGLSRLEDVDMGDHVLHYYQLPGARLELITYRDPQKVWSTGNTDLGIYRHFAVRTDCLEDFYSRCAAEKVPIHLEPSFIPQIGRTVLLIEDPNGVEIEIIQEP